MTRATPEQTHRRKMHIANASLAARAVALSEWRLTDTDPGAGEALGMAEAALDHPGMIPATAPGDVYLALHEAGRLPHPFADRAEAGCAWVARREWWYRADVVAPSVEAGQRLVLDFEGLDTFASIWLDGRCLATTDNMFRRWRLDVTDRMPAGVHRLAVCLAVPSSRVDGAPGLDWEMASSPCSTSQRNLMRKAQFGWGWDFAPSLPTVGLWKPAMLRVETRAVLDAVRFTTQSLAPDRSSAHIAIDVAAELFDGRDAALEVSITLRGPAGDVLLAESCALPREGVRLRRSLAQPALWWTPELGAAALHGLSVVLSADGVVVDRRELRVGVRTIALDTSPDVDEPDASFFRFVLNGVTIFARGVNWVPASSLVGAVDDSRTASLLDLAVQANMNMVRVWGGGVYESDTFYDRCDERGLLVWQDFMFACAPYPEHDPRFVDNVRHEIGEQVRRLRHHACLALWCGNNENQGIHGFVMSRSGRDERLPGLLYYDELIPGLLAELDPLTPYRPGSPFGGPGHDQNSMREGDVHDWTVWHGLPAFPALGPVGDNDRSPAGVAYTRYAENRGRFISEFGIQSSPSMETWRRALPGPQRLLGSEGFLDRIRDKPKDKVDAMLVSVTGLARTLEDYVDFTQIAQAEGLKFAVEHFRRRKPHCSGTLVWQFNDCWPGVSWSLVDFHGFAKAAYFYVRRAFAPVMASFKVAGDAIEAWVVNDTLHLVEGDLRLGLQSFDGATPWTSTLPFRVEANSSRRVWRSDAAAVHGDAAHFLFVRSGSALFPPNRHFFAPIHALQRPLPQAPGMQVLRWSDNEVVVRLAATSWLHFVHLSTPHEDTVFSDNFFDLAPGEVREVLVSRPLAITPECVSVAWR